MFNAEEIIELEKKWLKYKIKQKVKTYSFVFVLIFLSIMAFYLYNFLNFPKKEITANNQIKKVEKKETIIQKEKVYNPIHTKKEEKTTKLKQLNTNRIDKNESIVIQNNITTVESKKVEVKDKIEKKELKQEKPLEPFTFKLEPSEQLNELFSSNGELFFNIPYKKEVPKEQNFQKTITLQELNTAQTNKYNEPKKKKNIIIDMQEMDTIAYLKEKFYKTSSIVFALMIAEEYYNEKNYKESLKWSLIANDVDSQNEKSWYWFAKSKVKLNQRSDAIKALKAYLSQNSSKRLDALLSKIQHGDTNDL